MDAREKILATVREQAGKPTLFPVFMPEFGVEIFVQRYDLRERLAFQRRMTKFREQTSRVDDDEQAANHVDLFVDYALCADGRRMFSKEDKPALVDTLGTAIERVLIAALRVNSVQEEELAALGKASSPIPNGSSASASARTSE